MLTGTLDGYIPHLEGAMILFDALLGLFLLLRKDEENEVSKKFAYLVCILTLGTFVDTVVAIGFNRPFFAMSGTMRFLRATNGALGGVTTFALLLYILAFAGVKMNRNRYEILAVPLVLFLMLWFLNPLTGWVIDYRVSPAGEDGVLFMWMHYYIPFFFILITAVLVVVYRDRFTKGQLIALLINLIFVIALYLVQMLLLPRLMVTYYVGSVAVYTMFFALETPAYNRLIGTMNELEKAREDADMATAQAEHANENKTAFLNRLLLEIRTPVTDILKKNDDILERTSDTVVKRYAFDIRQQGEATLRTLDEFEREG